MSDLGDQLSALATGVRQADNAQLLAGLGLLLLVVHIVFMRPRQALRASEPATAPAPTDHLKDELSSVLEQTLPGMLSETLGSLLPPLVARLGSSDSPGTVTMDISTVQETVEQALVAKADVLLPKASAKLEQTLKDQLEQMRTELGRLSFASSDSVSKQLEKLVTNLESLQQLVTKAEQVEKTRFQTLDGSVKNKLENFETFLKGRLDTLETHVQSRVDLLSADMMTRFGSIDSALERLSTSQEKLEYLVEKLDGIADKLNGVGPKILQQNDRIEACVRERTTSVQGDVNRLIGESSQQNRDHTILVRTLTKSLESLQASVASMGAALSQAPVDSAGTTQLVEMTGTIKHLLDAVSANVKEMVDKASAVPSTRVVPPQRDAVAQPPVVHDFPAGTVGGGTMPPVIDLCSRIPAPVAQRLAPQQQVQQVPLATATLANGRQILIPEDEILGQTFRR